MTELTIEQALQKGIEAHKAGQVQDADHLYTAVLKAQPKQPDANHNMGVLAVGVGKVEQALPFFKTALEANSSIAQFWFSYIDALIKLERLTDAKAVFDQAKEKGAKGDGFDKLEQRLNVTSGRSVESLTGSQEIEQARPSILDTFKLDQAIKLAKKRSKEGSQDEARSIYQDVLVKFPKNKRASDGIQALSGGHVGEESKVQDPPKDQQESLVNLYSQRQLQQVLERAEVLLKQFPNSGFLYNISGAVYKGLGKLDASVKAYNKAIAINPDYAEAYYGMGITFIEQGKLEEAIEAYKKVLSLKPDYADAYNNIGAALQEKGELDEAIEAYNKALAIKPDYAEAYNNMGITFIEQGKLEEAIEAYNKALSIKPDYAEAYNNIGNALKEQGELEEAIEAYNKTLSIKPDSDVAYYNMGIALQAQGKLVEALAAYKKTLSINPDNAVVYNNMGNALAEHGRLAEATDAFGKALNINPDYAEAYNNMGIALQAQGKLEEAIEAYNNALSLKPDYAETYNNMGGTLQEQGKLEEAIDAYKKALSIKPDYADVWNNIVFPLQAIKSQVSSREDLVSYYPKGTGSHYYETEKSILNFRLDQESERASSALNETLNFIANADNSTITNPSGPSTTSVLKPVSTNKLIAMTHFGRSGTGLLHSLIDGHPDVSTLPSIYFSQYFRQSNWKDLATNGFDKIAEKFIKKYEVLFDASAQRPIATYNKFVAHFGQKEGMTNVGDQGDEVLKVDKILFCSELQRLMDYCEELNAHTFFNLVHLAYNKAINDFNSKSLIFYHIHNPDTYARLNFVRLVPSANWIMMVRDPIQSCESWIREAFKNNEFSDIANKIHWILYEIDNAIYHKQNSIGVRLEDLKEHPRKTIPVLCEWMGIEETESLYKMTAQGKKWWGDPSSPDFEKDGVEPFGQTSIKRKVGSIFSENDQFILQTLFYPFSVSFGYVPENFEQFKIDLQAIRPILDEMFDFEKTLVERTQANPKQFMKSGSYLYLRSGLIERWNTLNEHHTYPNMIKRLKIN